MSIEFNRRFWDRPEAEVVADLVKAAGQEYETQSDGVYSGQKLEDIMTAIARATTEAIRALDAGADPTPPNTGPAPVEEGVEKT